MTCAMLSKESAETACLQSFQIKIISQSQPRFPVTFHPKDNQADVSRAGICVCSQIRARCSVPSNYFPSRGPGQVG